MKNKNKYLIAALLFAITILLLVIAFNYKVSYYQGINYKVQLKEIPLYLKIIDFFSRHCHYKELVRKLINSCGSDEEKIIKLFEWTHENIRKVPEGFPIVDDHTWNIVIRGYGTDDQSADIFATLCAYAGFAAKWLKIYPRDSRVWIAVAAVKIKNRWFIFDPSRGNYFVNKKKEFASIDEVARDKSILNGTKNKPIIHGIDYLSYFENLSAVHTSNFSKADLQKFWPRLPYEFRKLIKKNK